MWRVKKGGTGGGDEAGNPLGRGMEILWVFEKNDRETGERRERAKGRKFREIIKVPGIITSEFNCKGTQQGRSGGSAPEIHTACWAVG